MRRTLPALLVLSLAGCSNAPLVGLMDCVAPSRARLTDQPDPRPDRREPRGDIRLPADPPPPVRGGDDSFLKPPALPDR